MKPLPSSDSIDEELRREFEKRLLSGKPGKIEDFLPDEGDPHYLSTLEELVHIEIELAWKGRINQPKDVNKQNDQTVDQPHSVESYLNLFPCLNEPEILARILKQECFVRMQEGMPLSKEACQARFPNLDLQQAEILPYLEIHSSDISDTPGATLSPEDPSEEGIILPLHFADFELLEEIGKGSMGIVYRAKQISNPRIVAVKILQNRILDASSAGAVNRFQQEIRAAAKLRHENIVRVFDVSENKGRHFFSMQYVRGKSLARLTLRRPLENQLAAKYIEQVTRAISYSHKSGILHRDLKPANILIDDDTDRALVADFGLAKISEKGKSITAIGETLGTPSFMAPEQARDAMEASEQSDIYSLGATLYAILSGKPPFFAARSSETLRQLIEEYPAPLRQLNTNVDRELEIICMKCMEKKPALRYQTADDLADDLERYQRGKKILARPRIGFKRSFRSMQLNQRKLVAFALTSLFIVGGSVALSYQYFLASNSKSQSFQRMEQAESLVGNAVEDLVDEHAPYAIPKTITEKKLLQEFLRYYSGLVESSQKRDTDSYFIATARLQMGRIETELGNLEIANKLLRTLIEDLTTNHAFVDQSVGLSLTGTHPSSKLIVARAWFSLGIVNQRLDHFDRATKDFQKAAGIFDNLLEVLPTKTDIQLLAADNFVKMGSIALQQQRWAPSQKYLDAAIRSYQQLIETPQPLDDAFFGLSRCYKFRGDWERLHGNPRGYRQYLEASYRELEQIVETPQHTATLKTIRPLVATCRDLGNSYVESKDLKTAVLWYEKAFHSSTRIASMSDPTGAYDALRADVLVNWASALDDLGRYEQATTKCKTALKTWHLICEQHPDNHDFEAQHGVAVILMGQIMIKSGKPEEAGKYLEQAKTIFSKLIRKQPGNAQFSKELEKVLRLLQQLEN
ncbi:MAG: serine/threonine-protein kinase [Planctomycetota bacterium]|nr:serine/threonine-protein kinase [Planctomycetota bacterium]